jgi:hypothetical protein
MNATYSTVGSTLFSICGRYSTEWLSWRGAKFTIGAAGRWASQQDCMYCINWKRMYANQIIYGMSSITTKTMITSSGASNLFNMFLLWNVSMTLIRNNHMINDNTKSPLYFVLASQGKYLYMTHNCPFLFLFFNCTNEDHNLENIAPPPSLCLRHWNCLKNMNRKS